MSINTVSKIKMIKTKAPSNVQSCVSTIINTIVNTNTITKSLPSVIEFSTREDLRDHIHDIHNFLRNSGAGYGRTGMQIFSIFYGLKLIEPFLKDLNLTSAEKNILNFSLLYYKTEELDDIFFEYVDNEILNLLSNLKSHSDKTLQNLGKFIFYEIPKGTTGAIWKETVKKIARLPVGYNVERKVNLSGKVYEYFVGRDKTAISEMGAYFSDRHITEFSFNKVKPILNTNKSIKTAIDPFGGSGGFTLGYANYLRSNYNTIDWSQNVNNIYHFDMEQSVINMTGLEMFAITGHFPSTDHNYLRQNSFKFDFEGKKYDYVFSNPPYGGDDLNKTADYVKREKLMQHIKPIMFSLYDEIIKSYNTDKPVKSQIKSSNNINLCLKNIEKISTGSSGLSELSEFIDNLKNLAKQYIEHKDKLEKYDKEHTSKQVNLDSCSQRIKDFAKLYSIDEANDKEACSLMLLADLLEKDGTAVLVLKEGPFFDNKYSKLRKVIIENYNITDIISIPSDAFENTTTKTSIIIFKNNGPTIKVNFSELVVELEPEDIIELNSNNKYVLTKSKGEIIKNDQDCINDKFICFATYDDLVKPTIVKNKKGEEVERYDYSLNYKNYKDNVVYCPKGYELKKLDDVCEINPENKKINLENNKINKDIYNYVEIGDISNNIIINYTQLNKNDLPTGAKKKPLKDDILVCSVRPNSNKIVYCNNSIDNLIISGAIIILRFKNSNLSRFVYNYMINNLDETLKSMGNGSSYPRISPEILSNIKLPIPLNISLIEPSLQSLQNLHQTITSVTELIPQKEKIICELIKELIEKGKDKIDYESYTLGQLSIIKDGPKIYKTQRTNKYIENQTLPLIKIGDNINEYVKISEEFNNNLVFKNDILISLSGSCGKITKSILNKAYRTNNLAKFHNIKINKEYFYYSLINLFEFVETNGSVIQQLQIEAVRNTIIKVLKPSIMKKHNLEPLFDEVDKLKEQLLFTKTQYDIELKELFKDFNTSERNTEINMKSSNQLDNDSDSNNESDTNTNINIKVIESKKNKIDEVKESKEVKDKSKVKSTNTKSLKSKVKSISATLDV
jgi:type I restriction-modification system DNA methylase subunit